MKCKTMIRHTTGVSFCFALLGCGGIGDPTERFDDTRADNPDLTAGPPETPTELDLGVNQAPCGARTVAVVRDDRGATYVFCSFGSEGAAALELRPSEALASLLDEERRPIDLFDRILPAQASPPAWVRQSLESGEHDPARGIYRYQGEAFLDYSGSCGDPDGFFSYARNSAWPDYYRLVVDFFGQSSNYTLRDCVDEHEFVHGNVGWVQRTASAYPRTSSGACTGAFQVRSCNGYTLMSLWAKASPSSGSWNREASYWVPPGGLGHLWWWSNSERSCHPSRDRDDIRVTSESVQDAYHHLVASFVGRARDLGTNGATCRIDPR